MTTVEADQTVLPNGGSTAELSFDVGVFKAYLTSLLGPG